MYEINLVSGRVNNICDYVRNIASNVILNSMFYILIIYLYLSIYLYVCIHTHVYAAIMLTKN
jgi:hypothetical protein